MPGLPFQPLPAAQTAESIFQQQFEEQKRQLQEQFNLGWNAIRQRAGTTLRPIQANEMLAELDKLLNILRVSKVDNKEYKLISKWLFPGGWKNNWKHSDGKSGEEIFHIDDEGYYVRNPVRTKVRSPGVQDVALVTENAVALIVKEYLQTRGESAGLRSLLQQLNVENH